MSDLGPRRIVRMGLATKFTAPVSMTLATVFALVGFYVYRGTADTMALELDRAGVMVARVAAEAGPEAWAARGHEGLARVVGQEGALDLWVLDSSGKSALKASKGKVDYRDDGPSYSLRSSPNTAIKRGFYRTPNGMVPARFFSHPMGTPGGPDVGSVVVVYSAAGIQEGIEESKTRIIVSCVAGLLVGALVAFLSAKLITRPLDQLLKDIKAVAGGKLDHRTRARSDDEIGTIAVTFDAMTKNLASAEEMRVHLADQEHQVGLAHEVQARLFPKKLPSMPGLTFDAKNQLSGELSADLFDAVQLDDGRVGLLVMTASGRGIPAAIVLSMARALFRALAPASKTSLDTLTAINARLAPDLRRGLYVSALYAIIDPQTGDGQLASAGHRVPALQFIAGSKALRRLQADGIAIGLDDGPVFERSLSERPFKLDAGDRLVLATEGAFQLHDDSGELMGEEALMRIVLGAFRRDQGLDAILATLAERRTAEDTADITLVTATRA